MIPKPYFQSAMDDLLCRFGNTAWFSVIASKLIHLNVYPPVNAESVSANHRVLLDLGEHK